MKWIFIGIAALALLLVLGIVTFRYQVKRKTKELAEEITEHQQTVKELRDSEAKSKYIFETVPEGISIGDIKGFVTGVNQAVVKMHGYNSKDEIIGRHGNELIAEKDREKAKLYLNETLEKGVIRSTELSLVRKDGSEFPAEFSTAAIKDAAGNPIGIIVVISDITPRIQATAEHQKIVEYRELDRLKTNLLSTVSHELRTPLASIKGYASMLMLYAHKLDKKQKTESIQAIDRATDRLTELIDHLLDMSRLDAGLLRLTLQPVKPREIIVAAVEEAELRSPKYKFRTEIQGRLPAISADGRRLRQIIDNILDNAVKYSPEDTEISLQVLVKPEELLISVADQGRGIPEAEYQKIFERMYRIEQRLKNDPGGLGLGLSLCKALVEAHGGRIWVESVMNKGSTFYFTIPLKNSEKGNKDGSKNQAKTSTRN
jgi:PAS domain S-box-containing protein